MPAPRRDSTPAHDPAAGPPTTANATGSEIPPAVPPAPAEPVHRETPRVPRTRAGAAWIGVCTAAVTLVILIIFMLQNTRSVEINFLWMHGNVPLALALLIAGVGVAVVAMVIGTARITQLRRLSRRD
jgi:uncharacterized integral membrane protein